MQTTFFIEKKFWVKDLGVRCYKDYVDRSRIEGRMNMIYWSFETYG